MLSGRVALVSGGSQGIGRSAALRLARDGATVAVLASRDRAKADTVVREIEDAGGRAAPYAADVADSQAVAAVVSEVEASLGPVEILVNSAGVFFPTPVGETPDTAFSSLIDVNLRGTWNLINAVTPGMRTRGRGVVVNVASVAGLMGLANYALYCASKAAVVMLTRALACELAPQGIRINCVAPGNTETPMNADIRTDPANEAYLEAMAARTPSGRVYALPEEIADGIAYLASDASRPVHGTCLVMDQGFSAGM